jgi:hypothetical protein
MTPGFPAFRVSRFDAESVDQSSASAMPCSRIPPCASPRVAPTASKQATTATRFINPRPRSSPPGARRRLRRARRARAG